MEIVTRAASALTPYSSNARLHPVTQIDALCKSIAEFGFTVPLLIDENNNVIAGHGRLIAAQKVGLTDVPCIINSSLTDEQKRAYIIADNRLSEMSVWDEQLLKAELFALQQTENFDFSNMGFNQEDLEKLLGDSLFNVKHKGPSDEFADGERVGETLVITLTVNHNTVDEIALKADLTSLGEKYGLDIKYKG